MTEDDIRAQIGAAAVERKACFDKMSCFEQRMITAHHSLGALLDKKNNPLHEDHQAIVDLASDPREDAKGYIAAMTRADELTTFLKTHNAL